MPYIGFGPEAGKRIDDDDALMHAMEECGIAIIKKTPETIPFCKALVEWYFSGNYVHESAD